MHVFVAAEPIILDLAVNIEQCVFTGFCKRQNPASPVLDDDAAEIMEFLTACQSKSKSKSRHLTTGWGQTRVMTTLELLLKRTKARKQRSPHINGDSTTLQSDESQCLSQIS